MIPEAENCRPNPKRFCKPAHAARGEAYAVTGQAILPGEKQKPAATAAGFC
jgi:hypothetical protein